MMNNMSLRGDPQQVNGRGGRGGSNGFRGGRGGAPPQSQAFNAVPPPASLDTRGRSRGGRGRGGGGGGGRGRGAPRGRGGVAQEQQT